MKTIQEALQATLSRKWVTKKNAVRYRSYVQHCLEVIGREDLNLADVDEAFVAVWREKIRKVHKRASTANRYLSALVAVLRLGGVTTSFPVFPVSRENSTRFFSKDELESVDTWFREHTGNVEKALYVVLRETGLRGFEELNTVRRESIDWTQSTIRVASRKGKSGDAVERTVPLTEKATRALSWLWHNTPDDQNLFTESRCRKLQAAFTLMRDQLFAGDPQVKPYSLRHTYAMRLQSNGVPLQTIARLLGHKSVETTMHYLHDSKKVNDEVLNALL